MKKFQEWIARMGGFVLTRDGRMMAKLAPGDWRIHEGDLFWVTDRGHQIPLAPRVADEGWALGGGWRADYFDAQEMEDSKAWTARRDLARTSAVLDRMVA